MAFGSLNEQLIAGQNDVSDAEFSFFPLHFASRGLDSAQFGNSLILPTMDAIEKSLVLNGGRALAGKRVAVGPERFCWCVAACSIGSSDTVTGRRKELVAYDQWSCCIDRGSAHAKGKQLSDSTICRIGQNTI